MIQKFVDAFMAAKPQMEAELSKAHPEDYTDLVKRVIRVCSTTSEWDFQAPDVNRLTVIDHGDYQGTLLYVVGAGGYQPSTYWTILVSYGSCSGCDTFEAIKNYTYDGPPPTPQQIGEYWTLMLHMVQNMKDISIDE